MTQGNHIHDDYIREHYRTRTAIEIAAAIGKSVSYIASRKRKLDLVLTKKESAHLRTKAQTGRTSFTPSQTDFVKNNYLNMPIKAMAKELGKSGTAVRVRMRQLNLEVPQEMALSRKRKNQFKPGHKTHNKGKSLHTWMPAEKIENMKATQFHKDHLPHNTRDKGEISYRPDKTGAVYGYIKLDHGNWQAYHRYLYRKHIGPLKRSEVVYFKNGNTLDFDLENLGKRTRAEHMKANSIHRYGPEMTRAMQLKKKIDNKLNLKK